MSKILVIDDTVSTRVEYKKSLTESGYKVEEATNGIEALRKYRRCKPDCVLLDISGPHMNGITTLHEILNADPKANVAMLSGTDSSNMVSTAIKWGAKDIVAKPVGKTELIETVNKLLGSKQKAIA